MRESDYEFIRTLVYERSRINLGPDKRELVVARLGKRVRATQVASIDAYCRLLRADQPEDEIANLIDAISTNHTYFFRENAHFEALRDEVLPEMAARRRAEKWPALRVWSAACSTGEEPYSIAMTLADAVREVAPDWSWQVEATDISHRVLERARAGIYPDDAIRRLPAGVARRHFLKGYGPQEGLWRVRPHLQERVRYGQLNLIDGFLPFQDLFHVIFCRNVMIYFDRPTQEHLVQRLAALIVPGGYLFVGHSESLTAVRHALQSVRPAIYRKPARPVR